MTLLFMQLKRVHNFEKSYVPSALNPLYAGKTLNQMPMGTFTNREDPDEMQHDASFHQGLHCLFRYM